MSDSGAESDRSPPDGEEPDYSSESFIGQVRSWVGDAKAPARTALGQSGNAIRRAADKTGVSAVAGRVQSAIPQRVRDAVPARAAIKLGGAAAGAGIAASTGAGLAVPVLAGGTAVAGGSVAVNAAMGYAGGALACTGADQLNEDLAPDGEDRAFNWSLGQTEIQDQQDTENSKSMVETGRGAVQTGSLLAGGVGATAATCGIYGIVSPALIGPGVTAAFASTAVKDIADETAQVMKNRLDPRDENASPNESDDGQSNENERRDIGREVGRGALVARLDNNSKRDNNSDPVENSEERSPPGRDR